MNAVLCSQAVGTVRWKLRSVMADRRITNKALAEALEMNPVSVSKLKNAEDFPEIGGVALAKLCDAITALSGSACSIADLLEYIPD
jgi:putative transcriptional regulator